MYFLEELPNSVLLQLITSYDRYIQEANQYNRYEDGWLPVCINEYLNNEFLEEWDQILE